MTRRKRISPTYSQRKAFGRMNSVVSGLESLLFEADKAKGWKWVHDEPLWTTWSLEKFGMQT